jgi:hypothetical protein
MWELVHVMATMDHRQRISLDDAISRLKRLADRERQMGNDVTIGVAVAQPQDMDSETTNQSPRGWIFSRLTLK